VLTEPQTRYVKSGDAHIAYQVVGDGPADLIVVRGYISHLEVAWESPALAAFYRRLASFCRLILFDKRGTGLSDRVPEDRLPTLEQRMDDVRAVMGGGRVRPGGAPRRVGGRPDVPAVRGHLPRAHAGAAAVGLLRPL
jgi:pimeloyl-ACP methyl ester carboxylesterase